MAKRKDKTAERVRDLFNKVNTRTRTQWEYINQKGFDFSNDNQLTDAERLSLEEQGMPTFTINRIMPVVEMLNFYATAQTPRWQAIGAEGSDIDVAAVFSDIADYIWYQSDGGTLYANAINDSITKSIGYLMVTVDPDMDNGMGDVIIKQPEPFDVYVDPKSRDMLFRDAAFILIRKVLPENHLIKLFPDQKSKIKKASSSENIDYVYTEKSIDNYQKDFDYKDIDSSESIDPDSTEQGKLLEYFELYEKEKIPYMNVFYKVPPDEKAIEMIKQQVDVAIKEMSRELDVRVKEQTLQLQQQLQQGAIIKERYDLEVKKIQQQAMEQINQAKQQYMSEMQAEATKIENKVITEKEFNILAKDGTFQQLIVDQIKFYGTKIKISTVVGDKTISTKYMPDMITEYPIIPFHFKWTGTPFPISAVSPLIGKQREMNKAHQLMIHNASLGSSLRWMYEEGSVDTDYWENYASSPGALLPIRPGSAPPTAVQPAPLSNAFFGIVNEGKQDMEYLAGIFGAMQGDTSSQHDTYRGMLAMDEYGTRRVKRWMKNSIEPSLKQLGILVSQFSRAVYTAHKVFRVVQPSSIIEEKEVEINVPMYNDLGESIGKWKDYGAAKFDVRIISGSTLPLNRWAYLDEMKQLMQLGVVDDIAVLSETDVRNKEAIVKRKSVYSQLQGQVSSMEERIKDQEGTIETLQRQLVQAGIKGKVMQAEVEINKRKHDVQSKVTNEGLKTQAQEKLLRDSRNLTAAHKNKQLSDVIDNEIKNLRKKEKDTNLRK
tara:strand:- start:1004 stop:3319 length:2316 start_codon:yes stop_codon:yes gene_type:complete